MKKTFTMTSKFEKIELVFEGENNHSIRATYPNGSYENILTNLSYQNAKKQFIKATLKLHQIKKETNE